MLKFCYRDYNQILPSSLSYFLTMDSTLHPFTHAALRSNTHESIREKVESKKEMEMDFISQFLELPPSQSTLHHPNVSETLEKKQISVATSQTFERSQSNLQNSLREPKTKSMFHNFQKHLVVTLRTGIRLRPGYRKDPVLHLAVQMWKVFAQSHISSKKVLHFLFGALHLSPEENMLQARNHTLPGAEQLLADHTPEHLVAAQEYLRGEVIRQGNRMLQRNGLSQRRMQKSDEFESYFLSFLEELQNGPLSRRLPKSEKLEIIKEIQRIREDTV